MTTLKQKHVVRPLSELYKGFTFIKVADTSPCGPVASWEVYDPFGQYVYKCDDIHKGRNVIDRVNNSVTLIVSSISNKAAVLGHQFSREQIVTAVMCALVGNADIESAIEQAVNIGVGNETRQSGEGPSNSSGASTVQNRRETDRQKSR